MPIEINGVLQTPYKDPAFLPLIPKTKKAQFRAVTNTPPRRRTEDGYITVPMPPIHFEAQYLRTSITGDTETVRYFKTKAKRNMGGQMEDVYTPEFLTIEGGTLNVSTATDPDLFWFLANHPSNKSNVLYDEQLNPTANEHLAKRQNSFLFEEIKQSKESKDSLEKELKISDAVQAIRSYTDNEAKHIYQAFGVYKNVDELANAGDFDTMRFEIIKQMKANYGKWERLDKDSGIGIRALMKDAESKNIITAKDGKWMWLNTQEEKKKALIMKCNDFNQKDEELYDFMRTTDKGLKLVEDLKHEIAFAKRNPDAARVTNKAVE